MSEEQVQLSKTAAIDAAVFAIKSDLTAITKKADNPFFKSKYADLNTHLKAVEPLVGKNGCALTQQVVYDSRTGQNVQVTKITHVLSGQSIESSLALGEQPDMQKLGSAITYARRYTLSSLLSMQAEDDDAEGTMTRKPTKRASSKGDF